MELLNFIKLGVRHKTNVFIFTVGILVITIISAFLLTPPYKAVIFTTIVPAAPQSSDFHYDGFYAVEASEKFAETVSGWGKNPDLLNKISQKSGIEMGKKISVSPQKKQNLIISAMAKSNQEVIKLAEATKEVFSQELEKYNAKSKRFNFIFSDTVVKFQKVVFLALIFGGILLGIFLGILSAYFTEFFLGKVSFDEEVEGLFKKKVLTRVPHKWSKNDLNILKSFVLSQKKLVIVGVDIDVSKIAKEAKVDFINFPDKASKISNKTVLVALTLGKTKMDTLKSLTNFTENEVFPVLVE